MDDGLAERVSAAAAAARLAVAAFPESIDGNALPWKVVETYDAGVRGFIGRDPRIEDERDRVLTMAVRLAETRGGDAEAVEAARAELLDAIAYLEQAVLRFGFLARPTARRR